MSEYRIRGKRLQRVLALAELPDLRGRTALVTGGTDGVGRALAAQLAGTGARTLLTARDAAKGDRVRDGIRSATGNADVEVVALDLASLASVRAAAADVLVRCDRLDLVICNAGSHPARRRRTTTADGLETAFGVNHLAHALLIRLLEERLRASRPSRLVVVASGAHRRARGGLDLDDLMTTREPFPAMLAYNRSKLANILYARELARRLAGSGVTVAAASPGGVDTAMMRQNFRRAVLGGLYLLLRRSLLLTPDDAAAGVLRVALDPGLATASGGWFERGFPRRPARTAEDDDAARRLWAATEDLLGRC